MVAIPRRTALNSLQQNNQESPWSSSSHVTFLSTVLAADVVFSCSYNQLSAGVQLSLWQLMAWVSSDMATDHRKVWARDARP